MNTENVLNVIYYLAIILVFTKTLGLVAKKIGLPQVVGMVVAGIILGLLSQFHRADNFFLNLIVSPNENEDFVLKCFSQVGVILILFSSGLETNFDELKNSGGKATLIALAGVFVPMLLGTLGGMAFMKFDFSNTAKLLNAIFIGAILAATSVGITVETLKELGKLNTKVGNTILSAAIIDDVLGIVALSLVTSFTGGGSVWITILKTIGFFAFSIGAGLLARKFFKWEQKRYPHRRRTSIYAFALCFLFAFCAEHFFGVAAITGAYMAGLMLSGMSDTAFVDRKAVVTGYMIFTPIFFAYIGLSADYSVFSWNAVLFGLVFVALGIIGKIIGCGLIARCCKFNKNESTAIGFGMIARGEVALAIYTTGYGLLYTAEDGTILGIDPLVGTIMLIVVSSILCPILLKLIFSKINKDGQTLPPHDTPEMLSREEIADGKGETASAGENQTLGFIDNPTTIPQS